MNAKVVVPVSMRAPMPFAKQSSSLVNNVCHIVAVGPFSNSLYSRDAPVVGSRMELMADVRFSGRFCMAKILVATEYLVDTFGGLDAGTSRLTRDVCC